MAKNELIIRAFAPVGLTKAAAESVAKAIMDRVESVKPGAEVSVVRFVPSSKAEVANGFQVIANTTVKIAGGSVRNFDSVATIEIQGGRGTLKDVKLPAFSFSLLS